MTCREKRAIEHPEIPIESNESCPDFYGYLERPSYCAKNDGIPTHCPMCWDRELPEGETVTIKCGGSEIKMGEKELKVLYETLKSQFRKDDALKDMEEGKLSLNETRAIFGLPPVEGVGGPRILDSGNRREFESGAVRDIQEGKGRCDLLPLDVVAEYLTRDGKTDTILWNIFMFQQTGCFKWLEHAIDEFNELRWKNNKTMLLEVAIHFEEGAKKYGDNNWRKGIPVRCYIDSGVRHYLKFLRGDKDEPHDRAFCWNMMCAIWTCKHHPELNEYRVIFDKEPDPNENACDDWNQPMEEPV